MPYVYKIPQAAVFNQNVKKVLEALGISYIIEGECIILANEEVIKAEEKLHSLVMAQLAFRHHLSKNKGKDMYWELKKGGVG